MSNMRPNWLLDIPAEEYHAATKAGEFITSHRLNDFRRCPLEFRKRETGEIVDGDTQTFILGRATHTFILEGRETFDRKFIVADGPINPKTGKAFGRATDKYREWAEALTKPAIGTEDFALIEKMNAAVHCHEKAAELLAEGIAEGTIRTELVETPVQARLDWYNPVADYIVDLKTCADLDKFKYDIRDFGYVEQMGFYSACVGVARGRAEQNGAAGVYKFPAAWLVAVEKKEPYRVGVFQVSAYTLQDANESEVAGKTHGVGNFAVLAELRLCREENFYPTRYEGFGTI